LAHFKDESAVPDLIEVLETEASSVSRGTAAWALGKIGGKPALAALNQAKEQETDFDVQAEIEKGLNFYNN